MRVVTRCSDGTLGWEEYSPYDGIIVTAGSPAVPDNLKMQLVVGGRMIIPVGNKKSQVLKVLTKKSDEDFDIENFPQFAFVPLIGKEGWKEK